MDKPQFSFSLLHPRYWLTWLFLGCWWLVSQLPYRVQMAFGTWIGWCTFHCASRRRLIAERNVQLCFPDMGTTERAQFVKRNFYSTGMALFETGISWFWPSSRLRGLFTLEGLEHLKQAEAAGEGVLLLATHFTTLDIGGACMNMSHSIDAMYRPHNNPVYNLAQYHGRSRHSANTDIIDRGDLREMVRALRNGRVVWYAPDQDYGRKVSIFVPFFGIQAATINATAKFARLGKAKIIPFTQHRLPKGRGYRVKVYPPLSDFPQGDDVADAALINTFIEQRIREQPEQYLWVHRRFKTRPPGEPDLYSLDKAKRKKRRQVS